MVAQGIEKRLSGDDELTTAGGSNGGGGGGKMARVWGQEAGLHLKGQGGRRAGAAAPAAQWASEEARWRQGEELTGGPKQGRGKMVVNFKNRKLGLLEHKNSLK